MYKFEDEEKRMKMNLQFFAADKEDEDVDDEDVDDEEEDKDTDKDDKLKDKSKGDKSKTFTQEQVTRMMAKEKKQGRNAAFNEIGINPKDKKMVSMFKAFIESQKTDEQKIAEKESAEKEELTQANQRAMIAEAKAESMLLGAKKQYVEDVVTLAMSKMTDDGDLKTIIGELKDKYPIWFGKESDEDEEDEDKDKKKGQKGTGSSIKGAKGKKEEETKGLGSRLAAKRKSSSKKSSYWS